MVWAVLRLLIKNKLLFSKVDSKETDAYWRAKEGVFLNRSRFGVLVKTPHIVTLPPTDAS